MQNFVLVGVGSHKTSKERLERSYLAKDMKLEGSGAKVQNFVLVGVD